mgnify:CR=1 FL=1
MQYSIYFSLFIQSANQSQLKSLKLVVSSGEPLNLNVVNKFYRRTEGACKLVNLYGLTETGADVTFYEIDFSSDVDILRYFSDQKTKNENDRFTSIV